MLAQAILAARDPLAQCRINRAALIAARLQQLIERDRQIGHRPGDRAWISRLARISEPDPGYRGTRGGEDRPGMAGPRPLADREDQVCFPRQRPLQRRMRVEPELAGGEGVRIRQRPGGIPREDHRRFEQLGQFDQRRVGRGRAHPLPGPDDRAATPPNQRDHARQLINRERRRRDRLARVGGDQGRIGQQDILRDFDVNRAGAAARRQSEGAGEDRLDLLRALDRHAPLRNLGEEAHQEVGFVRAMERFVGRIARHRAADVDQRGGRGVRLRDPGEGVGRPRPGGDQDHAGLAG
jgi:hypothetical protein